MFGGSLTCKHHAHGLVTSHSCCLTLWKHEMLVQAFCQRVQCHRTLRRCMCRRGVRRRGRGGRGGQGGTRGGGAAHPRRLTGAVQIKLACSHVRPADFICSNRIVQHMVVGSCLALPRVQTFLCPFKNWRRMALTQDLEPEAIMDGFSQEALGLLSRSATTAAAAASAQPSRLGLFGSEITNMAAGGVSLQLNAEQRCLWFGRVCAGQHKRLLHNEGCHGQAVRQLPCC